MPEASRHLRRRFPVARPLLKILKGIFDFARYRVLPPSILLRLSFRRSLGYPLDLENPQTLNEKIQWLKLHDRSSLHVTCADKLAVRDHIERSLGSEYLVDLLLVLDSAKNLTPTSLPNAPFIIKTNHNSGGAIIVRDKSNIDWPSIQHHFTRLLGTNYYYRVKEWQYKNIEPRVLVEELLLDENGQLPLDYKFHCFNGRVQFIQVDIDRHVEHRRNLYDRRWQLIDCCWIYPRGPNVPKPEGLDEMIRLAEILAAEFRYVRTDFYNVQGMIRFGELTFHPESGFGRFNPGLWDLAFGHILDLNRETSRQQLIVGHGESHAEDTSSDPRR